MTTKRGQTAKAKSSEHFNRMEDIRTQLGMSPSEFSIALGYVTSSGYQSSTKGRVANLMQLLAAEGVEMRYGKKAPASVAPTCYTLLAIHPDGKVDATPIGSPETASIMGKDYLLVPKA